VNRVVFTRMDRGTAEEFRFLQAREEEERGELPDHVLGLLRALEQADTGYRVNRLEHSLQAATRAQRDGADEETVVCALLHDVGDLVAPDNHAALAAALLAPYVGERNLWIVRHHAVFQGYYYRHHQGGDRNARERYCGHPWFEDCLAFCERWDQVSFDPDYDSLPLAMFEPAVRNVFGRPPRSLEP